MDPLGMGPDGPASLPGCWLVQERDCARGLRAMAWRAALAPGNQWGMEWLPSASPYRPPWPTKRRLVLLAGQRLPEALGNLQRLLGAMEVARPGAAGRAMAGLNAADRGCSARHRPPGPAMPNLHRMLRAAGFTSQ